MMKKKINSKKKKSMTMMMRIYMKKIWSVNKPKAIIAMILMNTLMRKMIKKEMTYNLTMNKEKMIKLETWNKITSKTVL